MQVKKKCIHTTHIHVCRENVERNGVSSYVCNFGFRALSIEKNVCCGTGEFGFGHQVKGAGLRHTG